MPKVAPRPLQPEPDEQRLKASLVAVLKHVGSLPLIGQWSVDALVAAAARFVRRYSSGIAPPNPKIHDNIPY